MTGYALAPVSDPNLFRLAGIADLLTDVRGDIRDKGALTDALNACDPEIVIHFAAQAIVRESYKDPLGTFSANAMGTANLLDCLRGLKAVRAFLNITTDKVYENREWLWGYRENEPLGGYNPYSASKACSEIVTASFRSSFFSPAEYGLSHSLAIATARAGNVIGGGDWAIDRLVPDFVRAIERGETVRIRNPNAIRPWQHVLEPLSGYLLLCQKLYGNGISFAQAYNFGPEESDARSVGWIVERLCSIWPGNNGYSIDDGDHPHEATYLRLDCSKAKVELGWRPRWDLSEALDRIIEWNQAVTTGGKSYDICVAQIKSYSERE